MDNDRAEEYTEDVCRLNAYISPETLEWLKKYKKETGKNSYGKVIDDVVYQMKNQAKNQLVTDILATEITNKVVESIKEPLDILRRRTGYSDRQTKVLTEVLNHMITTMQLDRPPGGVVTTDKSKTSVLTTAEQRIKDQLNHFAQQAATKKKDQAVVKESEQ